MQLHYGWVIVAVGALMTCIGFGSMFSLAVFLAPMELETGWSRTGISAAMTLDFIALGLASFGWGALTDRFGARPVVLAGALLLGFSLILASRAETLLEFQLVYGILVGIAAGSFIAPMIATVTGWFEANRALAVSLVSAGLGVAPMTVSPFASWLIEQSGWRSAQLTIGIVALVLLVPAALLVRRPPALAEASGDAPQAGGGISAGRALRSPQFIVLAATFFACCAAHSGPIFHTVSYAIACGLAPMAAVTIYSVEGLAGLGGRLLFGVAADRLGVKRVLVAGLLVQALAAGSYLFTRGIGEFYAVAIVFGLAYGGVMPLYAALAREYFPLAIMGTILGAASMVSSLGMALGPAIGGWIYDAQGEYAWLYIASATVGLGAVAIALAFPPVPSRARPKLQPA